MAAIGLPHGNQTSTSIRFSSSPWKGGAEGRLRAPRGGMGRKGRPAEGGLPRRCFLPANPGGESVPLARLEEVEEEGGEREKATGHCRRQLGLGDRDRDRNEHWRGCPLAGERRGQEPVTDSISLPSGAGAVRAPPGGAGRENNPPAYLSIRDRGNRGDRGGGMYPSARLEFPAPRSGEETGARPGSNRGTPTRRTSSSPLPTSCAAPRPRAASRPRRGTARRSSRWSAGTGRPSSCRSPRLGQHRPPSTRS